MRSLQSFFRRDDAVDPAARLDRLRYVVFDTEFTSLEQRTNRLLSVGALAMQGASIHIGEQFYAEMNPGIVVPGASAVVHRLRTDDLAQAQAPRPVLEEFLQFCAGAVLVGHCVHYDVDIVRKELAAFGCDWRPGSVDTANIHRWLETRRRHYPVEAFDERTIRTDLAGVATHYEVTFEEAHHALADAYVTAQVWQRELAALAVHGVHTWRQLKPALS